ncbi:hypothetical protein BD626DRAFT_99410 [Schizophyllum amplum]|uniref:Uncharacterized protein n=1 Tax=Schizophyllum amplum TaxID=97359 RepID=A0A550CRC9_9AGAR|nr:hypothetical protein BD626DRAFT_99410 [Auriculariopsis ampla]
MTICDSRALPPSWIRWNSQNIPADALNALFYPPERDRALAKYGDGSSQCSYGIISLQNSGLGCLSVELDVFTVGKLDDPRRATSLCATLSECYCAKGDDFIMWRRFTPARNMRTSPRATNICTEYYFGRTCDIMYEVLDASSLCTSHSASPLSRRSLPRRPPNLPPLAYPETPMTHSGGSTLRSISCRPPTAARTRHRA